MNTKLVIFHRIKQIVNIIFLLFGFSSFAQEGVHYTVKDGLPSNHVYVATQDVDGFMWFGTDRGIAKFDGESFKVFTVKDGLPNNDIWFLHGDNTGKVWYGSKSMYQGYIFKDSVYKFVTEDSAVISPNRNHFLGDSIWYKNYQLLNGKFRNIQNVFLNEFRKKEVWNDMGWDFLKDQCYFNPAGKCYYLIKKGWFYKLDFNYRITEKFKLDLSLTKDIVLFKSISYGLKEEYYFIVHSTGVFVIDLKSNNNKFFSAKSFNKNEILRCFVNLRNSKLIINIEGVLYMIEKNLDCININPDSKAANDRIVFFDRDSNIWEYSLGNGIDYYQSAKKHSELLIPIRVELVSKIAGDLYFCSGEFLLDRNLNVCKRINPYQSFYHINNEKNQCDNLVSTNGVFLYKNQSFIPIEYKQLRNKVGRIDFKDFVNWNHSNYFITSQFIWGYQEEEPTKDFFINDNFQCKSFVKYRDKLYLTSASGLLEMREHKLINVISENSIKNVSFLFGGVILDKLFIGTDGRGVCFYDQRNIALIQSTDGLIVNRIIEKDGFLWLSTQEGVKKVKLNLLDLSKSLIVDNFYDADGIPENNINDIYLENDTLYVATDNGLAKVFYSDPKFKTIPKPYFETSLDTLVYLYKNSNNISMSFGSIDFNNQKYLKYDYRILPLDSTWIYTKSKSLIFNGLAPGEYTIQIRVTDHHYNSSIASKILIIIPEWWQTTIARLFFVLLGLGGMSLIIYLFVRRNRVKDAMESEREKKIAGLELQALRSQMNPHFVHNSLNSIQYYVQRNDVELSEGYIAKFSRLVRKFFEYSKNQNISLYDEIQLIKDYLEIEKLRFEENLNFKIEVDPKLDVKEYFIPCMILQPIVENAVNHGIFHKQGKGILNIEFVYVSDECYSVMIMDNGIGINRAKELNKSSIKNYNSHSTSVLMERLELLKYHDEWDIKYEIIDRSDVEQNTGTIVNLEFNQIFE